MTFSEKIIKLRKSKGLTQDAFASIVSVSRQAVYKWESGQSYPEAQKLVEIKKLFGISIDDLLDDSYEVVVAEKKKLPKKERERIEAEVEKEEIKAEEAPAAIAEETPAPAPEAPVANKVEEKKAEEAPAQKKIGFFARLFGRK